MSEKAKLNGADIDKALESLQLQKAVDDTVILEKGMTVDKRAGLGRRRSRPQRREREQGVSCLVF